MSLWLEKNNKTNKISRNIIFYAAITIIGIIAMGGIYYYFSNQFHKVTLFSSKLIVNWPLNYGDVLLINFTIPNSSKYAYVTGSYISSNNVICNIFNQNQYELLIKNFTEFVKSKDYVWSSGNSKGFGLFVKLPPGKYYIIFYNNNTNTQDELSVLNDITLYYK
ncbi:hypothetical protein [Caldisphaera sp.]|uniref:hypothetical protein n=1 Tax=Caldisphaera sp. TaxID=2060322 RepID=UPI003D0BB63C